MCVICLGLSVCVELREKQNIYFDSQSILPDDSNVKYFLQICKIEIGIRAELLRVDYKLAKRTQLCPGKAVRMFHYRQTEVLSVLR